MKSIEKWGIRRNIHNYKEINHYFSKLNRKSYSATGRWIDEQDFQHEYDFLIFPHIHKSTFVVRQLPSNYVEVSWEWFEQNILQKNPKEFVMKYTKNNLYVGFTFGPKDTKFIITAIYEDSVDFEFEKNKYPKYLFEHLWNLLANKGWDYHIKKEPIFEIY